MPQSSSLPIESGFDLTMHIRKPNKTIERGKQYLEAFEIIRCRKRGEGRDQCIETNSETKILGSKNHIYITKTYMTSNKVIANLKVTDVSEFGWVGRDVKTRERISVKTVRLGTTEAEKSNHVFSMKQLFAYNASRNKLGRARGINHDGLFEGPP